MRFVFDDAGYVRIILYGCTTNDCVEYTGLVPSEPEAYADMDDWADRAQTQAYFLNDQGNLTYDAEKAASLPTDDERLGIIDIIYPVGSIYLSVNSVSPETLFGGTWVQIEDRFLLAAGSIADAETEGGAEEFALSVDHKHLAPIGYSSGAFGVVKLSGENANYGSGNEYKTVAVEYSGTLDENVTTYYTGNATVNATIPTMPPYLAVYMWKRTA